MPTTERSLSDHAGLTDAQLRTLRAVLPGAVVRADLGWGGQYATVLAVEHDGRLLTVKATGPQDHHADREIHAYRTWVGPLAGTGDAPTPVLLDEAQHLLVLSHLPGRIVVDHPAQDQPDTYRQAGRLLARLHAVQSTPDDGTYWEGQRRRLHRWLEQPHRIPARRVSSLASEVESWTVLPTTLVPTHGDVQPRNWLVDDTGRIRLIDFGRAELRPAATDVARLSRQDFLRDPALAEAFRTGYGTDLHGEELHRAQVVEAVGTAVWAYGIGDRDFEAHGLRSVEMLTDG